jgi:hypothetical protein
VCWNGASREQLSGKSFRLQFDGIIPDEAGWNDVNFLLSELLRDEFNPKNIVRLVFWAQPDMDEANDRVEVDVFTNGTARFHKIRTPQGRLKAAPQTSEVVQFTVVEPFEDLKKEDREMLVRFNRLPLQRRIRFWQQHIAPHFVRPGVKEHHLCRFDEQRPHRRGRGEKLFMSFYMQ